MKYEKHKYGIWNLNYPTEIDNFAYNIYLLEFNKKYLKGSPYLDQITFKSYYHKNNDNEYYKKAKQLIRINKLEKINKLENK